MTQARYREEHPANVKQETSTSPQHGIKRERDEEVEQLIASSSAKKVKNSRPMENGEVMNLCDVE